MNLFEKGETTSWFRAISDNIRDEINKLTNAEICNTDLGDLAEYYFAKYQIEEIQIFTEIITKELTETKIQRYNQFYRPGYSEFGSQYHMIDGYKITFTIPFDGDKDLLDLRPSTFYMQSFPVDRVIAPTDDDYGKIIFSLEYAKSELQRTENSNEIVQKGFQREIDTYFKTIETINKEVRNYNSGLQNIVEKYLEARLQKANDYLQMRERLELPLKINANAPNTKPIVLKKNKEEKRSIFSK